MAFRRTMKAESPKSTVSKSRQAELDRREPFKNPNSVVPAGKIAKGSTTPDGLRVG